MTQVRKKWWFVGVSALVLAACSDELPTVPSSSKPTASLHITAATSGSPLDPDGYAACVDFAPDGLGGTSCAYGGPTAIGVNGTVTVTVDTGAHTVLLMGLESNCAVGSGNPLGVYAQRWQTVGASFAVACVPAEFQVTTTTSGVDIDPNGYDLCIDTDSYYGDCAYDLAIGVNGSLTVPVAPGSHYLVLNGVADNCTVGGDNPRTVAAGASTQVPFVIMCAATGAVRATVTTSGIDVHPDGYQVCVDRATNTCYSSSHANLNGTVAIGRVIVGSHTVSLVGVPGNCVVGGTTSRAVTVLAQDTVSVTFGVACALAERIAFSTAGTITVVHADGSSPLPVASGAAPAWAPDGTRLAYECGQDICAINSDGSGLVLLTQDAAGNHHPSWSPDGSKIAFSALHNGTRELAVMAANGSGVVVLTQNVGFLGNPAWSPDGTRIAFDCSVNAGNDDICFVNADGTGFTRLTSDPARDYGAAWKPDGSTLAFATTRYGTATEIALLSVNGGSVTRIGAGLPGLEPTWSPDGTQLAFVQVYEDCDYYYGCNSYDAINVAGTDGSNVRNLTPGDQPAWKPHK